MPIERRYVDAASLNVRESPDGNVVGKLARGQEVQVQESRAGWLRVVGGDTSGWIASRYTCGTAGCWRPVPAPTPVARVSRQSYGSGCPCSGSTNCIGPRGGRYCITSGGNKRYR
ncbi:SH3 domain-containing protein [Pseudoxanthomonas suwonensis]|uniref:SH3 domain-containing protein n=1 Tax=Pseudoxanthomonas suwonensis TaxID=314722 RepID=UPI003D188329